MHIKEISGITVDIEGYRNIRSSHVENGVSNQNGEGTRIKKEQMFG